MTHAEAYQAARDAERAWRAELHKAFGDKAVGVMWTDAGKGKPDSPMGKAWRNCQEASRAWWVIYSEATDAAKAARKA